MRGFFLPFIVLVQGSRHFQSGLTWRGCERRTAASSAHPDPRLLLARVSLPRLLNLSKRDAVRSTLERRPEDSRRGDSIEFFRCGQTLSCSAARRAPAHIISHHYLPISRFMDFADRVRYSLRTAAPFPLAIVLFT